MSDHAEDVVPAEVYALAEPILREANSGIVGLGPGPYAQHDGFTWPTEGYDSALVHGDWERNNPIEFSGHTREEWLALADVMLARWKAFRRAIAEAPADG